MAKPKTPDVPQPVKNKLVGMTEFAWHIVDELKTKHACRSVGELLEWLVLCQQFSESEALALLKCRRGPGRVWVVPDDAALPPEG